VADRRPGRALALARGAGLALLVAPSLAAACAADPGVQAPATVRPTRPGVGAAGIGDPDFPELGNGGYDVQTYDLDLDVAMPEGALEAVARIRAAATEDLEAFHLDLHGLEVGAVEVDGSPAAFERDDGELVVRPAAALRAGASFEVLVRYSGVPRVVPDPSVPFLPGVGWFHTDSGTYVMSECSGASSWFPCNDHPLDKATFRLEVTAPKPWMVAANGVLREERDEGERRTFVFEAADPMATYLATVNVSRLERETSTGPNGLPLVFYYPPDATEREREPFGKTAEMIARFEELFGPYPFESFGNLLTPERLGGALETQTLPVYSRGSGEGTVAHELAHQWFGNSVSLRRWRDMWLNEGFASYAEWLWREHTRGAEAFQSQVERSYRTLRRSGVGSPASPPVGELFGPRTYGRGALALHMLRREVGDETFFRVLRTWCERFHDGTADTAAFVALSEEVAGRDLDAFFDAWLFSETLPEVPEWERAGPDEGRRRRRGDDDAGDSDDSGAGGDGGDG